jgi:hypothetical protein
MSLDTQKSERQALLERWRLQSGEKRLDPLIIIGGPGTGKTLLSQTIGDLLGGPSTPHFWQIDRRGILDAAQKGLPIIIDGGGHLSQEEREFLWLLGHRGQNIVTEVKFGVTKEVTLANPVFVVITAQNNYLAHDAGTDFVLKLPYIPIGTRAEVPTIRRQLIADLEHIIVPLKK